MLGFEPRTTESKSVVLPITPHRIRNGGKGEIRTHTGHRMKVLHNHYATLPYRNTLRIRTALLACSPERVTLE